MLSFLAHDQPAIATSPSVQLQRLYQMPTQPPSLSRNWFPCPLLHIRVAAVLCDNIIQCMRLHVLARRVLVQLQLDTCFITLIAGAPVCVCIFFIVFPLSIPIPQELKIAVRLEQRKLRFKSHEHCSPPMIFTGMKESSLGSCFPFLPGSPRQLTWLTHTDEGY